MTFEEKVLSMLTEQNAAIKQIQTDVSGLKQGQAKLEQGQTELKQDIVGLTTLVHGVIQHQNEDYALLQSVAEKVDRLNNVTDAHEEKFQKLRAL